MSGGAIAGIVIGVIVLIFAITVLVLDHFEVINIPWPWKKKQKPKSKCLWTFTRKSSMIYNKFEEDDTIATVARTKTLVMECSHCPTPTQTQILIKNGL